ncbi:tetratricopeptide repeat protein [Streptomyces sp. NPDC007971]|uniref:tetratricopeptide repeat protein n=1 Tax=Streptomyces sp. NPDC007971 TaxID=3364799 RepID=UPI0036E4D623
MPTSDEQITALVSSGADLAHTVIWLNETQRYLGPGKLSAKTVRQLLADTTQPVILIGTIWPREYERLIRDAPFRATEEIDWDSRDILRLAQHFTLKEFSEAERDRAKEIASTDPRLKEALSHERGNQATEVLAAAPELIRRWENASDPLGAAILKGGIIAGLCGHPEPIPLEVIKALAVSLLTPTQRAQASDNWLASALSWACEPVRGDIAPLRPEGAEIGQIDGYCVTDILTQHVQCYSPITEYAPEEQWTLLIEASSEGVCLEIGDTAHFHGRERLAQHAWRRGAISGNHYAMVHLGTSLIISGQITEGRSWLSEAIRRGVEIPPPVIGCFLILRGAKEEGRSWIAEAVQHGGHGVATMAGLFLMEHDPEEGHFWLERAVQEGESPGYIGIALAGSGILEEGHIWLAIASDQGGAEATIAIAELLLSQGNTEEAQAWFERAVQTGGATCATVAGLALFRHGAKEEGRAWLERAAELDGEHRMALNGLLLAVLDGEVDEGRIWLQRAEQAGFTDATIMLQNLPNFIREIGPQGME